MLQYMGLKNDVRMTLSLSAADTKTTQRDQIHLSITAVVSTKDESPKSDASSLLDIAPCVHQHDDMRNGNDVIGVSRCPPRKVEISELHVMGLQTCANLCRYMV